MKGHWRTTIAGFVLCATAAVWGWQEAEAAARQETSPSVAAPSAVVADDVYNETPEIAGLTAAAVSPNTVRLSWAPVAADNASVTWLVYKNETPIAALAGSVTEYAADGLSPSRSYAFRVDATMNGQVLARSTLDITTQPAYYNAAFQDRNEAAGLIEGILTFNGYGFPSGQPFRAYFTTADGEVIGQPIGEYVAKRYSFKIPEQTPVPEGAAALTVFALMNDGQTLSDPLVSVELVDAPAGTIGGLGYIDADPSAALAGTVVWSDPALPADYDGYVLIDNASGARQLVPRSPSGHYSIALSGAATAGPLTVVPYKGDTFYYSYSRQIQPFNNIRAVSVSGVKPGAPDAEAPKVTDVHFTAAGDTVSGAVYGVLHWYDAAPPGTKGYVVYTADAGGAPLLPLAEVQAGPQGGDPFHHIALSAVPLETNGRAAAGIAVYAIRAPGASAPVTTSVYGEPTTLFEDTDPAPGRIGGTVQVKPTFPDYGASLYFVDYWKKTIGDRLDWIQGENRYFVVPPGTAIPGEAWRLAIFDNGGQKGSPYEKLPLYVPFIDRTAAGD